jgi:hypothetical protein
MKRGIILFVTTVFITASCNQQKNTKDETNTNQAVTSVSDIEYPYAFQYNGNPLARMHGAADPDVHVWDGTVWMYCSQDRNKDTAIHKNGYDSMDGYHVFSSKDMINWIDHGEIFHSKDVDWGWELGGFMWAPGAARKDGTYYLYYPHKDKEGKWRIGVATGSSPTGPFEDIGQPLEGLGGIDPKIFIDDDGVAYIYNNPGVVARLKPNMIELAEEAKKIVYAPEEVMENDTLRFLEGAFMHK